jgi:hypothetical protein
MEKLEGYDEIFDFIEVHHPDWSMEQILKKFNLRITDISFTDYYGIVFGIEKLEA